MRIVPSAEAEAKTVGSLGEKVRSSMLDVWPVKGAVLVVQV